MKNYVTIEGRGREYKTQVSTYSRIAIAINFGRLDVLTPYDAGGSFGGIFSG